VTITPTGPANPVKDTRHHTILLLADDPQVRRLLTVQLQLLHYVVGHLASLEDAARVRVSSRTVLALIDLESFTPQAIAAIRRLDEFCPVIVLTAADAFEQAMRAGAADNLVKPVPPARLSAAIERAIETRALRRTLGTSENHPMHDSRTIAAPANGQEHKSFTLSFDYVPTMEQLKSSYIDRMLAAHGGNREAAARAMGISARNLYRHIADKRARRAAAEQAQNGKHELA